MQQVVGGACQAKDITVHSGALAGQNSCVGISVASPQNPRGRMAQTETGKVGRGQNM